MGYYRKIFIANRGEIACRAIRPARELGIPVVVGYSDCDALSLHVKLADEAVHLGPSPATKSYLDIEAVLRAAIDSGCDAIFPGYGFLADRFGNVIHLGERECSIQRRHQKLVEEAPSSLLTPEVRARMGAVVVKAMKDIGYETAGTLEFLVDKGGKFYALEVNTRIQVEHTVTEMITGFDIIRKMYKIAAGDRLTLRQQDVLLRGHAIQCRINAEDPKNGFAPSFGRITFLRQICGPFIRTESGIYQGWEVPSFYDSLLAKICSVGKDRGTAIQRMRRALREYDIWGVRTTIPLLRRIMDQPDFVAGKIHTGFIDENIAGLTEYEEVEEEIYKAARFVAEVSGLGRNVHSG